MGFPPLYSPNLYFFSKLHLSLLGQIGPGREEGRPALTIAPEGLLGRGELVPSRGHGGQALPLDDRGRSGGLTLLCSL